MKTELDEWSLGEKLCLAASVVNKGENWAQVSKNMETWSNTGKTNDWYSQKNCALQYSDLLEKYAGSKKKRVDVAGDLILRKLTIDRINELTLAIQEEREQYMKLKQEVKLIESKQLDHRLEEIWERLQGDTVAGVEDEEVDHPEKSITVEAEGVPGGTTARHEDVEQIEVKEEPSTPQSHLECTPGSVNTTAEVKHYNIEDIPREEPPKKDDNVVSADVDRDEEITVKETEDSVTEEARPSVEDNSILKNLVLIESNETQRLQDETPSTEATSMEDNVASGIKDKAGEEAVAMDTETVGSSNEDDNNEQGKVPDGRNQLQNKELLANSEKTDDNSKSDFELSNSGDESSILDAKEFSSRVILKSEPNDSTSRSGTRVETSDSITEESDTSESVSRKETDSSNKGSTTDLEKPVETAEIVKEDDSVENANEDTITDSRLEVQPAEKEDIPLKDIKTLPEISQQQISANIPLSGEESVKQVDVYEFVAEDEDVAADNPKPSELPEDSESHVEIRRETPSPKLISVIEKDEDKDKEKVQSEDAKHSNIEKKGASEDRIVQVEKLPVSVRPIESDKSLERFSTKVTDPSEDKHKVPEVEPIGKFSKACHTPEKISEPCVESRNAGAEPSMFTLRLDSFGLSQSSSPEVKRYESRSPWSFEQSKKLSSLSSPSREMIKVDSFDRASRDDSRFRRFDPTKREEKSCDEPSVSIVEKQIYVDESSLSRLERKLSHRSRILSESDMSDGGPSTKSDRLSVLSASHELEEDRLSDRRSAKKRHVSPTETPLSSMPSSPASSITIRDGEMDDKAYKTWKKAIMLVWREIAQHKYASIFLQPITDKDAPGYHNVVNRPVDLQKIKRNIECGTLRTTAEFQREILLMFLNAIMYNSSDHDVHAMAKDMQQEAINIVQEFLNTQMLMKTTEVPKTSRRETRESSSKKVDSEEELPNKRKRTSSIAEEKLPKRKRLEKL